MTAEQYLLAAVTAVTGALVVVTKMQWARGEKCEKDRDAMQARIEQLERQGGVAAGQLQVIAACPEQGCPFRREAHSTLEMNAHTTKVITTGLLSGIIALLFLALR